MSTFSEPPSLAVGAETISLGLADAGVVDRHDDAPVAVLHRVEDGDEAVGIATTTGDKTGIGGMASQFVGQWFDALATAGHHCDDRTVPVELDGHAPPEVRGRSGDDGDRSGEPEAWSRSAHVSAFLSSRLAEGIWERHR